MDKLRPELVPRPAMPGWVYIDKINVGTSKGPRLPDSSSLKQLDLIWAILSVLKLIIIIFYVYMFKVTA